MAEGSGGVRRFTLQEANTVLPSVRRVTDAAVSEVESITRRMERAQAGTAQYNQLDEALQERIALWALEVEALGGEVKGLWLVDFDNGDGYYCWQHPEREITHYHGYTEGFAGRMKIV